MSSAQFDPAIPYLTQLGWLPSDSDLESNSDLDSGNSLVTVPARDGCLLKLLAEHPYTNAEIKRRARDLHRLGFTLRDLWSEHHNYLEPSSVTIAHEGNPSASRLVFGHQRYFASNVRFATIACSQLGRDGRRLPNWPRLLEYCARTLAREGWTLLIPRSTTLANASLQLARQSGIPHVIASIPSLKQTCGDWLGTLVHTEQHSEAELKLSPALVDCQNEPPALQDRFAIAFAERLVALYLRPKGKLIRLIEQRLKREHQTGSTPSVRVLISPPVQEAKDIGADKGDSVNESLLRRGAVGWYVAPPEDSVRSLSLACCKRSVDRSVHQPIMKIEAFARGFKSSWPFLAHCTRGSTRLAPDESQDSSQFRNWIDGYQHSFSSLEMLYRIASQSCLLASNKTKRTRFRSVSFSACRLPELLAKRTFQSHLGRWDWEPYGFLICRTALESLGAKPVYYGDESEFQQLTDEQKPFFQPFGKSRQWEQEQEWRLLDDLRLGTIPPDNTFLFCATRDEATNLASQFPWTVLFLT